LKYIIYIFFFCSLGANLTAQQVYFNNTYDYNGDQEVIWSVLEVDEGYLCGVGTGEILLLYLDTLGSKIWEKSFGYPNEYLYPGYSGSLIQTFDGGYALGGSVNDSTGNQQALLVKFKANGDTLWTKRFGGSGSEIFYQCKQTQDRGFVIIGITTLADPDGDILLIKTDSLGNKEWEMTYGGGGAEYGFAIDICFDGSYILGGFTESTGAGESDTYIIKTDISGNEQWSKTYGGVYRDGIAFISETADSGYIIGSALGQYKIGSNLFSQARIIKLDKNGDTEWDTLYGPVRKTAGFGPVHEIEDGSYVTVGQVTDLDGRTEGLIAKVGAQGDSIWYRNYEIFLGSTDDNYLRDIKPTKDGGYIAVGFAAEPGIQDMWVLKLDSMGCEVENCFVWVEELENWDIEMKIYPNPFSDNATIEFDLPSSSSYAKLVIFDITGREVKTCKLQKDQSKVILDANDIGSGLFFIQLITNTEVLASKKAMIVR